MAPMNKPPSLLSLLGILVLLAVFGVFGAKYMLNATSQSTLEQLGVVWPGVAAMAEPDRAFLVELALTCNLATRQKVRTEVVACLRSVEMDAAAKARLERLLGEAPG